MNEIPDTKKCLAFLQQAGCSDIVIAHCKAVREVAVRIAIRAHANVELVNAGALLHDIGRSRTHGIQHGLEGARIAQELGLPQNIRLIIERHLGAGIPKEEAVVLGLPDRDFLPQTLEEKIVAHADNLIDNDHKHPIENEVAKALKKGQKNHAARLLQLHRELSERCGIDLDLI